MGLFDYNENEDDQENDFIECNQEHNHHDHLNDCYYWLKIVWLKWRWKWPKLGVGTTKW